MISSVEINNFMIITPYELHVSILKEIHHLQLSEIDTAGQADE